jgi:hypothetical protein
MAVVRAGFSGHVVGVPLLHNPAADRAPLLTTRRRVAALMTNREAPAVAAGLAFVQLAGIAPSLWG